MAINLANERRAIAGVGPIPDGTIDAQDRRHISGYYPTLARLPQGLRIAALGRHLPGAAAAQGFLPGAAAAQGA